jgi:hypothetical protein
MKKKLEKIQLGRNPDFLPMLLLKRYFYILIVFAFLLAGCSSVEKKKVRFKDIAFTVEVARTKEQRLRGLMFRESLPFNSGMLFICGSQAIRPVHMKNTYIPLDIIWINEDRRVVFVKKNAKPENGDHYETVCPDKEASYILEVNAGTVNMIGLKEGDLLRF